MNPYQVIDDFESALSSYTRSPYVVCVSSCTSALLLACLYNKVKEVEIPRYTYCSVPMSIINAGGTVKFRKEKWQGMYQLRPYPIWDSARWFTSNMYMKGQFICLSFHASKTLGIEAGGAILTDDFTAYQWFRKARHDGRTPGKSPKDDDLIIGQHCIMNPSTAAQGILKLHSLPKRNPPLENDDYPRLDRMEVFK